MKTQLFSFFLCGAMILGFAACGTDEPIDSNNPQGETNSNTENGHAYVDLGLSVMWATCNVGATEPEEYGDYFAWGETQPKSTYDWSTYKYGTYNNDGDYSKLTKYNKIDGKTTLYLSDNAATANWGGKWRMPNLKEQKELLDNCTWTWTICNGVNGYEVKGKNGNSIFLPAAGLRNDSGLSLVGSYGNYWSSSLYSDSPDHASYLFFTSDGRDWNNYSRYCGRSVRAVCSPN